jgi:hypothetical protein
MIAEPVIIETNIGDSDKAGDELPDRSGSVMHAHVEIERFFPHRNEVDHVPRLAHIFLGDLKLDGFVCFFQGSKEGDAGSRTWKSMGPFLIWMITLSSNWPSSWLKLS